MHIPLSEHRRVKLIAFLQYISLLIVCTLLFEKQVSCIVNLSNQHERTKRTSTLIF